MRILLVALLLIASPAFAQSGLAHANKVAATNQATHEADEFLRFEAAKIKDAPLRTAVLDLLDNPAPTFMALWPDDAARGAVRQQLIAQGLLTPEVTLSLLFPPLPNALKAPQPFDTAPGGTPEHHHGYPGGLAIHTAFNLQAALDLSRNYYGRYGVTLDSDLIVAVPILHDTMKSWCFQWQRDGSVTPQVVLADTGHHHVFGVAEALHRGLPPAVIVAMASAHDAPMGATSSRVVNYLRAAAILAKADPAAAGLAKEGGGWKLASLPSIEATVIHLSDHDFVLLDPAAALEVDTLHRLGSAAAAKEGLSFDDARLTWMRHRIHATVSGVQIYQWMTEGGDARVAAELEKRGLKLIDKSDPPREL